MFDNFLMHYGTPRHSGRYPWGSGDNPYQRNRDFYIRYTEYKKENPGLTETQIAKHFDMSTTQLRAKVSMGHEAHRAAQVQDALAMHDQGLSATEIGKKMGLNESSVRSLLKPRLEDRENRLENTANFLADQVAKKGYIDVGAGTELDMNVTKTQLKTAIAMLEEEGYKKYYIPVVQLGTGHKTSIEVLAPPNTEYRDVYNNKEKIKIINEYLVDGGKSNVTALGIEPPKSISSDRIMVRYAEDGGKEKDGVIEIRRGVDDLSLGNSRYAQVRIAVDDTHFLKGMAMYNDGNDMPKGVDIIFNTNKHEGTPKEDVFKKLKDDPDNPFGATIKEHGQSHYIDKNGEDQLSAINKVNEEGDWSKWSKTLASQMLSKQTIPLAKRQLNIAYENKMQEFEEIKSLTNPAVKEKLLESFADDCDSSAVSLKAAALPRQASHVILPFPEMKENEIYAPNYKNGERVVLIRYPHGGTFEIPELVVNNKEKTANSLIHNAKDAVGINSKVAERLSGADFDGDTVLVIPVNDKIKVRTSKPLKGLEDFDPKEAYPAYPGMPKMKPRTKQTEMGKVSNLITDMTLKGATPEELARAVRHSMVVIDAEKHNLNYKQSAIDNGIEELKAKYQAKEGGGYGGASTIISRAGAEYRIPIREEKKGRAGIDPETGKKLYNEKPEFYTKETTNKKGEVKTKTVERMMESTRMYETDDAFELVSKERYPMEIVYATYANRMKALGNEARKEILATTPQKMVPSAKKTYEAEVSSLNAKLNNALKNAPRERQAQILANSIVNSKKADNPELNEDRDALKKVKGQALATARIRVGAKKELVDIEPREWEAIQAGAISNNKLVQIINNSDLDKLKELATPRSYSTLPSSKIALIKSRNSLGYSTAEIADSLGISTSTVQNILSEK